MRKLEFHALAPKETEEAGLDIISSIFETEAKTTMSEDMVKKRPQS